MPISSIGLKENIRPTEKWSITHAHNVNHRPGGQYAGACRNPGYGNWQTMGGPPSGQIGWTNIMPMWNQWLEAGQNY